MSVITDPDLGGLAGWRVGTADACLLVACLKALLH